MALYIVLRNHRLNWELCVHQLHAEGRRDTFGVFDANSCQVAISKRRLHCHGNAHGCQVFRSSGAASLTYFRDRCVSFGLFEALCVQNSPGVTPSG